MKRTLLSWSSGKDSAWSLGLLRADPEIELVGLVTTINESAQRVAMHAVRGALLEAQARAAGLPLWRVPIPSPCSNEEYQTRMKTLIERAKAAGVTHMAFGDLYLEDIRQYRVDMLAGTGIEPLFPAWCGREGTRALAERLLAAGVRAHLTCVDPRVLPARFAGRVWDAALLDELPEGVDPMGENGEFHTFCTNAPGFDAPVAVRSGEIVERDGFVFADLLQA